MDLVLLQVKLGQSGDANVAFRVQGEGLVANVLGLFQSLSVGLEDAESLVDERQDVGDLAVVPINCMDQTQKPKESLFQ